MRTDLTERDPVTDAVVARFGMLIIGFLFIAFTAIIYFILSSALQPFIASVGVAIDGWTFLLILIATLVCLPIIAAIKHVFLPNEKKTLQQEISHQFSIYSVTRKDWSSQLKHALLMWLIVFVPLDFLSYLIPGMLEFQALSLYAPASGEFLGRGLYLHSDIFAEFIGLSILVHLFVAMREETLYRGVLQFWGQEKVGVTSAMVISAVTFGLSHFSYWFTPLGQASPIYFPIWWAASGLFVGLMLGFYLRTTGRILPMILAHWWNNIVSTIAIWMFLTPSGITNPIATLGYMLYLPLILCGVVLLLIWRHTVLKISTLLKTEIKSYLHQPPFQTFLDILFGVGIWLILSFLG